MKIIRILALSFGLATLASSALAQAFPETIEFTVEHKAARKPIGVGTVMVQNAVRPWGRGWTYARGASVQIINARTSATVAWGIIDNVGNWSGTVPAGERYLFKITDDRGRLNYTTFFGFSKAGGIRYLRNPRLRY